MSVYDIFAINFNLLIKWLWQIFQVTYVFSASHGIVLTLKSERISEANLSSVKVVICAGSKLLPSTALDFLNYLPKGGIVQIYGLSEMGGASTMGIVTPEWNGSVGRLKLNSQAKIIDDDGNRMGANESGEIYLKPGELILLSIYFRII